MFLFFFFQAEDGIRDFHVTGVQTCALPIFQRSGTLAGEPLPGGLVESARLDPPIFSPATKADVGHDRSEERRVGKEYRSRWPAYHSTKKNNTPTETVNTHTLSRSASFSYLQ